MIQPELSADVLFRALHTCPTAIVFYRLVDPTDDRSFLIVFANDAATRMTGLSREEMVGHPVEETFPASRERGFIERFARVLRTGQSEPYEDTYYADDRLAAAFSGFVAPISNDMVAVSFENTTLRKQMEDEAARAAVLEQESQHRAALLSELEAANRGAQGAIDTYELVASAAEEALWEVRFDEPCAALAPELPCRFSDRFAQILGVAPSEVDQRFGTFYQIVHPEDVGHVRDQLLKLTREPAGRMATEYRIVTKSGQVRHAQANARVRVDAEGGSRSAREPSATSRPKSRPRPSCASG